VRQCDIKGNKGAKNEGKMKEKKSFGIIANAAEFGLDCDILGDGHWSVLRQGCGTGGGGAPKWFFCWWEMGSGSFRWCG